MFYYELVHVIADDSYSFVGTRSNNTSLFSLSRIKCRQFESVAPILVGVGVVVDAVLMLVLPFLFPYTATATDPQVIAGTRSVGDTLAYGPSGAWCSIYDKWNIVFFFYIPSIIMALVCLSLCIHILFTIRSVKSGLKGTKDSSAKKSKLSDKQKEAKKTKKRYFTTYIIHHLIIIMTIKVCILLHALLARLHTHTHTHTYTVTLWLV